VTRLRRSIGVGGPEVWEKGFLKRANSLSIKVSMHAVGIQKVKWTQSRISLLYLSTLICYAGRETSCSNTSIFVAGNPNMRHRQGRQTGYMCNRES